MGIFCRKVDIFNIWEKERKIVVRIRYDFFYFTAEPKIIFLKTNTKLYFFPRKLIDVFNLGKILRTTTLFV